MRIETVHWCYKHFSTGETTELDAQMKTKWTLSRSANQNVTMRKFIQKCEKQPWMVNSNWRIFCFGITVSEYIENPSSTSFLTRKEKIPTWGKHKRIEHFYTYTTINWEVSLCEGNAVKTTRPKFVSPGNRRQFQTVRNRNSPGVPPASYAILCFVRGKWIRRNSKIIFFPNGFICSFCFRGQKRMTRSNGKLGKPFDSRFMYRLKTPDSLKTVDGVLVENENSLIPRQRMVNMGTCQCNTTVQKLYPLAVNS